MKKIYAFLAAAALSASAFSQTGFLVSGKVIDSATNQPMVAASVFAENTTLGTVTEADGSFRLMLPNGGYNLVVTFTGYRTATRRISTGESENRDLQFILTQKEKELQDVVVRSSNEVADGWEKYGGFFLEQFIGKTANSKQCALVNPEALKFYFNKRRNRLKVMAGAALEIKNDALGYVIKYTLDSFVHEYNTELSVYSGYPLFQEMKPQNDAQQLAWNVNRAKAYSGSILHFMRSLYNRNLREEGFEIQFLAKPIDKEVAIPLKDFYGALNYDKDDSTETVEVRPNQLDVAVIYKKEEPESAYLEANPDEPAKFQLSVFSFLPEQSIVIERNGYYFDQTDFIIKQYLAWEKMADMLPYDYPVR